MVFVLEILMLDITAGSVIPLLIASITATTMAFLLRGFDPILAVTLVSIGMATAVGRWTSTAFDAMQNKICACYTVLEALAAETRWTCL